MTAAAFLLVAIVLALAVGDWSAVAQGNRNLEYICKPLTTLMLLALAVTLDPDHSGARAWFVVALVFSLAGDVLLMLPTDRFVQGLAAFFVAHLAYVVGLLLNGLDVAHLVAGIVLCGVAILVVGTQIVRTTADREPELVVPVMAYIGVISTMVATAIGTGRLLAIVGALLFYASDALIGWARFVRDFDQSRLAVMVTYHLGQLGLVLSLV